MGPLSLLRLRMSSLSNSWKHRLLHGIKGPRNASIRPAMIDLMRRYRGRPINVLEIGARYGDSSEMIMRSLKVDAYTIIDPYVSYGDYSEDGFNDVLVRETGDAIFKNTRRRLGAIHRNVCFIRELSDNKIAINAIEENSCDIVFVDGNHEYEFVLKDLVNYYPKLKMGGSLVGDDFHTRHSDNDLLGTLDDGCSRKMVFEAVEKFANDNGYAYLVHGSHRGYPKIFQFIKG